VGPTETLNDHIAQSCHHTIRWHRQCNRIVITTSTNLKVSLKVHEMMNVMVDPRSLLKEELLFEVGPFHHIQEGNCHEFKLTSSSLLFEFGVFIMPRLASHDNTEPHLSVMAKVSSPSETFQGVAMVSLLNHLPDKLHHSQTIPCYHGNTFLQPNFMACSQVLGSECSGAQYLNGNHLFFKVVLLEDSCRI